MSICSHCPAQTKRHTVHASSSKPWSALANLPVAGITIKKKKKKSCYDKYAVTSQPQKPTTVGQMGAMSATLHCLKQSAK